MASQRKAPDDYRARLIAARERIGLSPRRMAKMLMTPRQTYEQWESGERRTPGAAVFAIESIRAPKAGSVKGRILRLTNERSATVREIADALGIDERHVHSAVWMMRRDGWPLTIKRMEAGRNGGRAPKTVPTAKDMAIWRERQSGDKPNQIAARHGISRQRVHQVLKWMMTSQIEAP